MLLLASRAHAGGILIQGGVCPATYPTSIDDVPGAASTASGYILFAQTGVCVASQKLKFTCDSNSVVTLTQFSDGSCRTPTSQTLLGSANTCITSANGNTISFFSCDSPTALPPFVLKNGGVLINGPGSSSYRLHTVTMVNHCSTVLFQLRSFSCQIFPDPIVISICCEQQLYVFITASVYVQLYLIMIVCGSWISSLHCHCPMHSMPG